MEPKPEKVPIIGITITDQFFPDGLIVDIDDVNKADRLLVPASKDLSAVPVPLDPVNVDHFLCYKVKPPEGTEFPTGGQVQLVDQFIDPGDKLFDIGKPRRLCNPVSKEFPEGTVSEIQSPDSHLMCYSVKQQKHSRIIKTVYLPGCQRLRRPAPSDDIRGVRSSVGCDLALTVNRGIRDRENVPVCTPSTCKTWLWCRTRSLTGSTVILYCHYQPIGF